MNGNGTRRGRRPLDDTSPSVDLCLALPERLYDEVYAIAAAERCTIQDVIRRALARELDERAARAAHSITVAHRGL